MAEGQEMAVVMMMAEVMAVVMGQEMTVVMVMGQVLVLGQVMD